LTGRVHSRERPRLPVADLNSLQYGLDCGKKIRTVVRDYGTAVIAILPFVKWHWADEHEMKMFAKLCVNEEETKSLIPLG
jgi:hypothetical protein